MNAVYERIRAACTWAAADIDLDEHAALITRDILDARRRPRHPYDPRIRWPSPPAGKRRDKAVA